MLLTLLLLLLMLRYEGHGSRLKTDGHMLLHLGVPAKVLLLLLLLQVDGVT